MRDVRWRMWIVGGSYMIGRGYDSPPFLVWIVIHLVIIARGYGALRRVRVVTA